MTAIIILLSLVPLLIMARLTRRFGFLGLVAGLGLLVLVVIAASPDERPERIPPCQNEISRINEQMQGRECPPTVPAPVVQELTS